MALCKSCGQQIPEDASSCPNCGTSVDTADAQQNTQQAYQAQPMDADVQKNKSIAWLAYFGILLLIPLFARKASEFCKYHVKQGALLLCVDIAYNIVTNIFTALLGLVFRGHYYYYVYVPNPIVSIFSFIFGIGNILLFVLAIIGIVNAATGKYKEVPILGKIKILDPLMDKIYASLNK